MDITQPLAIWGAILSTVAVTWNVVRDLGDRPRLKVEAMIGKMYPDHTDREYVFVTITNIGRRPVVVKGCGGRKKKHVPGKRGIFIVSIGLPRTLKEGEYHNEWTPDLSFINDDLEKIHVWDSAGREWKISRKNLRYLLKTGKEGASPKTRNS